jgi:hypothetical protein
MTFTGLHDVVSETKEPLRCLVVNQTYVEHNAPQKTLLLPQYFLMLKLEMYNEKIKDVS